MNSITIKTEGGEVVLSPLTVKTSLIKSALYRLVPIGVSPVDDNLITNFVLLVVHTSDASGLDDKLQALFHEAKSVKNFDELNNACNLFYELIGDDFALFNTLLTAVVSLLGETDETDDQKKDE